MFTYFESQGRVYRMNLNTGDTWLLETGAWVAITEPSVKPSGEVVVMQPASHSHD